MKRVNCETYRVERSSSQPVTSHLLSNSSTASFDSTGDITATSSSTASSSSHDKPRNVVRRHERIKLTQRYRILSARDPHSGVTYNLAELLEKNILNRATSQFCLPSTGQLFPLDEAIKLGYVHAQMISEQLVSSNDLHKSIVHRYVKINDLRSSSANVASSRKAKVIPSLQSFNCSISKTRLL